jgi:hypothetical protein
MTLKIKLSTYETRKENFKLIDGIAFLVYRSAFPID